MPHSKGCIVQGCCKGSPASYKQNLSFPKYCSSALLQKYFRKALVHYALLSWQRASNCSMQWIIYPCSAHLLNLGMVLLHNCWTYQIFVPGLVSSHVLSSVVGHLLETVFSPDFCMHWLCFYQSFHLKITVDWRLTLKCLYPVYSYFHASMIDPWGTAGMFLGRAGIEVWLILFFCPSSHCCEVTTILLKLWYRLQIDNKLGANIFLAIIWFNFESCTCCSWEKPWQYFLLTRGKCEFRKQLFWLVTMVDH